MSGSNSFQGRFRGKALALCGGVGGAKLALGLSRSLPAGNLACVVNTGDDFRHLGLHVSPDIDTVLYTLGGRANPDVGWGREGETWRFMEALGELGGETWFRLGDTDLATHVTRTLRLERGERLTAVTQDLARAFGIGCAVLPMSDQRLATLCDTDEGALPFQRYFVERQCQPRLTGVRFDPPSGVAMSPEVEDAFAAPDLSAIILCPSNPFLSIDPMLAVDGLRDRLATAACPRIAVSPIIAGDAVKGPLAKILAERGAPVTPQAVLEHYAGLIDVFVIDEADAIEGIDGVRIERAPIMMRTTEDKERLARTVLALAEEHRGGRGGR